MSSPPNPLCSPPTESKCYISGESNKSEMDIMNECVDALLYEDGKLRPLTDNTLNLLKDAKEKVGEANALFLEAIRLSKYDDQHVKYLRLAEEMGCDHPVFYYLLVYNYTPWEMDIVRDESRLAEYFTKAIAGGCSLGYALVVWTYAESEKPLEYYLDLERQGNVAGIVYHKIGEAHVNGYSNATDYTLAKEYLQRGIDLGYVPACFEMYELIKKGVNGDSVSDYCNYYSDEHDEDCGQVPDNDADDSAIRFLLDADGKALFLKDERVLVEVIDRLTCKGREYYKPKPCTLKKFGFTRTHDMALHYCDVLIQRGSSVGYYRKNRGHLSDLEGVNCDCRKAIEVAEEAERLGLANYDIYKDVLMAYYTNLNGMKGLEYGEKALQVCTDPVKHQQVLLDMAKIYELGMSPVEKNPYKALEYYERALQVASLPGEKRQIYEKMANIWKSLGDVNKENEYRKKALMSYIEKQ